MDTSVISIEGVCIVKITYSRVRIYQRHNVVPAIYMKLGEVSAGCRLALTPNLSDPADFGTSNPAFILDTDIDMY